MVAEADPVRRFCRWDRAGVIKGDIKGTKGPFRRHKGAKGDTALFSGLVAIGEVKQVAEGHLA